MRLSSCAKIVSTCWGDLSTKRSELNYAVRHDGTVIILIEAKGAGVNLSNVLI